MLSISGIDHVGALLGMVGQHDRSSGEAFASRDIYIICAGPDPRERVPT